MNQDIKDGIVVYMLLFGVIMFLCAETLLPADMPETLGKMIGMSAEGFLYVFGLIYVGSMCILVLGDDCIFMLAVGVSVCVLALVFPHLPETLLGLNAGDNVPIGLWLVLGTIYVIILIGMVVVHLCDGSHRLRDPYDLKSTIIDAIKESRKK